jgi:hypothetical protein
MRVQASVVTRFLFVRRSGSRRWSAKEVPDVARGAHKVKSNFEGRRTGARTIDRSCRREGPTPSTFGERKRRTQRGGSLRDVHKRCTNLAQHGGRRRREKIFRRVRAGQFGDGRRQSQSELSSRVAGRASAAAPAKGAPTGRNRSRAAKISIDSSAIADRHLELGCEARGKPQAAPLALGYIPYRGLTIVTVVTIAQANPTESCDIPPRGKT